MRRIALLSLVILPLIGPVVLAEGRVGFGVKAPIRWRWSSSSPTARHRDPLRPACSAPSSAGWPSPRSPLGSIAGFRFRALGGLELALKETPLPLSAFELSYHFVSVNPSHLALALVLGIFVPATGSASI